MQRGHIGILVLAGLTLGAAWGAATVPGETSLLPCDTRWEYPQYLTWRPGNGQVCDVNPPRMSWPYVPRVIPASDDIPRQEFRLQLSRQGDFSKPDHDFHTPYNFYNALPVLKHGTWYWRVGFGIKNDHEQWSPVRIFELAPDAIAWDRTVINEAVDIIAKRPHPRVGPPRGDWEAWRQALEKDPLTADWIESALARAEKVTQQEWWDHFPKTDRHGESALNELRWAELAKDIVLTSFAYHMTRDPSFARSREQALALARIPRGGLASPEFHGAKRKWSTQITGMLALAYDWWYPVLNEEERKTLLDAIEWRLKATYLEKHSWASGDNIARSGVAVFPSSHPYENFMWSLPPVLLTAGDLAVSDELTPLCLHYLTGVTCGHGPDEGWNEGLSYGAGKGSTMLHAAMYTALIFPELELGKSPYFYRLAEWFAHLAPLGIQRLAFGDYAASPDGRQKGLTHVFRYIALLSGDAYAARHAELRFARFGKTPTRHVWLDLAAERVFSWPPAAKDGPSHAVFREAGWVMESTAPPGTGFEDSVGLIFMCRPRGGYSHSYRAENDFVWHAYGETLSAGAGGTAYPDPHSRHSMSHNVLLINGQGQERSSRAPDTPFAGRLLAYERGEEYAYWVGDATHAYETIPELRRWHRHVLLVEPGVFLLFDDIAMRPEAEPAIFSWLFHVAPEVPLEMDSNGNSFTYQLGKVHARVAVSSEPGHAELVNLPAREGFKNPITGEDMFEETVERLKKVDRDLPENKWMAHNLWLNSNEPVREWRVLTALSAWRDGAPPPQVRLTGHEAEILFAQNGKKRVSFDAAAPGDITVNVETVRRHAEKTDLGVLPPTGKQESLTIDKDTYTVEWLARESFEHDDWAARWFAEGDSEVSVRDGKLWIRGTVPEIKNVATVWYRPELPQNAVVRFHAKAIEREWDNAANLNLFLHARENNGSPVRFGRSGNYPDYHEFPNYIVTFVGGVRPGWSRARRNPGFELLHEEDIRSEVGTEYEITVTIVDGHLRYYLDGKRIHNVHDSQPLPAGRFALRTWNTDGWWDDFEFGNVLKAAAEE